MAGEFKVDIIRTDALAPADIVLWRQMLAANPDLASPYFRPEFTQVAGAISPEAAVAIFTRRGQVVAFFPHQRRGGTVQPLGSPMNDYHGVIAHPGQGPSLEEVALLLKAPRLRVSAWVGETSRGHERETLMVAMPAEGYAAWYAERRKTWAKYFKDKERARRSLEAELGEVTVQRDLRDPALLDQIIALKRDQYRRTGRHDIFDCGWTVDLLHALLQTRGEDDFGASMAAMQADGKLTAAEYSLHAGNHYHFWFPVYEPSLARCSPGILLSMDTMRLASDIGYRVFDFGFGGEGYKKYFCNRTQAVREGVIKRPGLTSTVSDAAVGLLNTAGDARGDRLRTSVSRRWAAIEACEITPIDRFRGVVSATQIALHKGAEKRASRLSEPRVTG
jgi:CelD/BcsL family acetyltransferase involved in cellulose biosynthesis